MASPNIEDATWQVLPDFGLVDTGSTAPARVPERGVVSQEHDRADESRTTFVELGKEKAEAFNRQFDAMYVKARSSKRRGRPAADMSSRGTLTTFPVLVKIFEGAHGSLGTAPDPGFRSMTHADLIRSGFKSTPPGRVGDPESPTAFPA